MQMRLWFCYLALLMGLVPAMALGMNDEAYGNIVRDFAGGSVPELETLAQVKWRIGRCVRPEDKGRLYSAALRVQKTENGPYYDDDFQIDLFFDNKNRMNNDFDNLSSQELDKEAETSFWHKTRVTGSSIVVDRRNTDTLYIRSSGDIVLIALGSEDEPSGMCYFFRDVAGVESLYGRDWSGRTFAQRKIGPEFGSDMSIMGDFFQYIERRRVEQESILTNSTKLRNHTIYDAHGDKLGLPKCWPGCHLIEPYRLTLERRAQLRRRIRERRRR